MNAGSLRIAFVACNKNPSRFREDPSYIYRSENLAAALERMGHKVVLLHVSRLARCGPVDVAVFHRPRLSWMLRVGMFLMRSRGVRMVADYDDLVFDPALAEHSPGVVNGLVSLMLTREMFAANLAALLRFDRVTVSTSPLIERVLTASPRAMVALIPNAVHFTWRSSKLGTVPMDARQPVLTYMPGTRSHDRDFAVIAEPISYLLDRHPSLKLAVTGPLSFMVSARSGQIERHDKVPFSCYHERMRAGWVNLAPLESSPFTQCKSALKVLEAGYWNVPTVCSPLPDAVRFEGEGVLLADSVSEWTAAIEGLLSDPLAYRRAAEGLRERILKVADIDRVASHWLDFVRA